MFHQPIYMEENLGRLVWGLTPETTTQRFSVRKKWFRKLLGMVAVEGHLSEEKVSTIEIEVTVSYSFTGLKNLPNGGFVAVFTPAFGVLLDDFEVREEESFHFYDRYYRSLIEITQREIVEIDIPDIERVGLVRIDAQTGDLVFDSEFYWRVRN